jgi:hypothetical protein
MAESRALGSADGMVVTHWGASESLRGRMLRPGPGSHSKEVEINQRERLSGAMVACVSERGYHATRVTDLVQVSDVSGRTPNEAGAARPATQQASSSAVAAPRQPAITVGVGSSDVIVFGNPLFVVRAQRI